MGIIKWQHWENLKNIEAKEFICGFCGNKVASAHGFFYNDSRLILRIYICPNCGLPSFFYIDEQHPGPLLGRQIENLPEDIKKIYIEIRESIKNKCFTAALLLGRKLIMHIAVDIAKAKEGESFKKYIEHLKNSGYIPPNGEKILNCIRGLGNEKNHEIRIGKLEEAEKILKFIEILLIFIYEFSSEFEEIQSNS